MKIALCFPGQSRSFKIGYEYYKRNLLPYYDIDTYIHTWAGVDNQEYLDLFKPVKYKIEPQVSADLSKYTRAAKHPVINIYSMYYSLWECSLLIEGNYDWVIRARTDYALNVRIVFEALDNTKLYIPDDHQNDARDAGNDQFAFSSQDNMIKYMSTFVHMDRYYDEGYVYNGENFMQANLRHHGLIGDKLFYTPMNNPFPPQTYSGWPSSLIREDFLKWNPGATTDW